MATLQAFTHTAREIARRVQMREWTMDEVACFYVERTEKYARDLGSHLYWDSEDIFQQVKRQKLRLQAGETLPLAGVPIVVKDNICMKDIPTSCGSKILAAFKPPYDAHVVECLWQAGAIFFGKANCDEFAMGSSNENSAFGPAKNPWDKTRVPGGSSGGSAAAVAADLAPISLGSDTGGSIRQPAALCGVVGLKPSYGRVSRYGLVAYGSSLDQIGPLTRSVEDAALVCDLISGYDERDSTSLKRGATQTLMALNDEHTIKREFSKLRIGIVEDFVGPGLDEGTRRAFEAACDVYRSFGAKLTNIRLPHLKYAVPAYYLLATAEASANLARYDGVKYGYRHSESGQSLKAMYRKTRSEGFGREVKQRIMLGTFALSSGYYDAYYAKASCVRQLIQADFEQAFSSVDLLLSPTSPTTAFKLGEKTSDSLAMYLSDGCTIAANLASIPAISIPCGFDATGLPVGLQLMAPLYQEELLLQGAYLYEQVTKWQEKRQPVL